MNTTKESHTLLDALENGSRIMEGCWAAFSGAQYYGLAAFAAYEATERRRMALQIANHLAGHHVPVVLSALPAPPCEYPTGADALMAMCNADHTSQVAADQLYDAVVQSGESPYFLVGLRSRLDKEREEVEHVRQQVTKAISDGTMQELNILLLEKYSHNPCKHG